MFNGKNILDVGNSNFALLDDPKINEMMDKAEVVNDPAERNKAWGEVDKAITEDARRASRGCGTRSRCSSPRTSTAWSTRPTRALDLAFTSIK